MPTANRLAARLPDLPQDSRRVQMAVDRLNATVEQQSEYFDRLPEILPAIEINNLRLMKTLADIENDQVR